MSVVSLCCNRSWTPTSKADWLFLISRKDDAIFFLYLRYENIKKYIASVKNEKKKLFC